MKKFYVGVKAVITQGDKVLIVKTDKKDELWSLPGGRVDFNESLEDALTRELGEELKTIKSIEIGEVLGANTVLKDIAKDTSLVLIYFRVNAVFSRRVEISEELSSCMWANLSQALPIVHEGCKPVIKKVLAHRKQ